jgi:hypothetical protein
MSDIQLRANFEIGGVDFSSKISMMTIKRRREGVVAPPTGANIRRTKLAGALEEELEIMFRSNHAAASVWADLYDAIDTDTAELTFSATHEIGAVGADNPEFSGTFVCLGVDTGAGAVGALRQQTQTYPITGAGITKNVTPP